MSERERERQTDGRTNGRTKRKEEREHACFYAVGASGGSVNLHIMSKATAGMGERRGEGG